MKKEITDKNDRGLILQRKLGQKITIVVKGEVIVIDLIELTPYIIRLKFNANKDNVEIFRNEVLERESGKNEV